MHPATTTGSNRLQHATSPYLRQHAHQPVDWWSWCPEALELARRDNKPILLSIGYSACHWCHVMAHESFDDPAVAALMNRLFVNIKVDREERPDLDRIYQTAHQLLARRAGGWPLTLLLTPDDQVPFFAGTYFPPTPRHGLPAFADLIVQLEGAYRTQGPAIREQNQALLEALASLAPGAAASGQSLHTGPLDDALEELIRAFDARDGGFGGAPKFPHAGLLEFLLGRWANARARHGADRGALDMASHTLERMLRGGIHDHLGGGFSRYSVDAQWMIPHFEKMLYDNGPLLAICCDLWSATGQPRFRDGALACADWVMRDMQSPEGGYYSSLDADSEGEEGKFYVWDRDQVRAVLGEDYALFAAAYGLSGPPNFEGRWHLRLVRTPEELAPAHGLDAGQAGARLEQARARLLAVRSQRVPPGRDDKCLTSWNALMIKGMAHAGRVLGRPEYLASAERALDFVVERLWSGETLLASYKDGQAQLPAYLDDHAFLLDAVLELLQCRWRRVDLDLAIRLADRLLEQFQDPAGGFFFTSNDHERLIQRPKPLSDDSMPSGNGIAARSLARLGHLLGEPAYLDAAEQALRVAWPTIGQFPSSHASLLEALAEWLEPPDILVLRGSPEQLAHWRERVGPEYAPRRLVVGIPADATGLPGLLAHREPRPGGVAYLCRGHHCLAPLTTPDDLAAVLAS